MIVFISIVSFFLDGILSKYISLNSIFLPLFTIVSLVIIYPYFNNNIYRYLKFVAIIGILYGITYLDTVFFNFFIFMILGIIICFINYLLSVNLYSIILTTSISIIMYRLIIFLFVLFFKNHDLNFLNLLVMISKSLILNIIYSIIIYLMSESYSNKKNILRAK